MNEIKKLFIYPIVTMGIIVFNCTLAWLLTLFFSLIFYTSIEEVVYSPMILAYVAVGFGTIYMIISACFYIEEKL